jgi:hypothetical protein
MIVYSILMCYNTLTICRLGCKFPVTVFLCNTLIYQSRAGLVVSSQLVSYVWVVYTNTGFD